MKWMHRNRTLVAGMTLIATLLTHVAPVAAWYDPKTGRFLQRDPNGTALLVTNPLSHSAQNPTVHVWLTPQQQYGDGMNFYQYAMSNPVNRTDPSGLFAMSDLFSAQSVSTYMRSAATWGALGLAGLAGVGAGGGFVNGYSAGLSPREIAAMMVQGAESNLTSYEKMGTTLVLSAIIATGPLGAGIAAAYGVGTGALGYKDAIENIGDAQDFHELALASYAGGVSSLQIGGSALLLNAPARSSVSTARGLKVQDFSPAALALRTRAGMGLTLYRIGKRGSSQVETAQFWAPEHPLTPGYAQKYGVPPEVIQGADFIQVGRLKSNARFITRKAESVDGNLGGGLEIVVEPGGVDFTIQPFQAP